MAQRFSRVTMQVRKARTADRGAVRIERFVVDAEECGMRALHVDGDSTVTIGERFWQAMGGEAMAEAVQRAFRRDLERQGYSVEW